MLFCIKLWISITFFMADLTKPTMTFSLIFSLRVKVKLFQETEFLIQLQFTWEKIHFALLSSKIHCQSSEFVLWQRFISVIWSRSSILKCTDSYSWAWRDFSESQKKNPKIFITKSHCSDSCSRHPVEGIYIYYRTIRDYIFHHLKQLNEQSWILAWYSMHLNKCALLCLCWRSVESAACYFFYSDLPYRRYFQPKPSQATVIFKAQGPRATEKIWVYRTWALTWPGILSICCVETSFMVMGKKSNLL